MLAIRMQRTGRKSHAMFRVVVQDSRRTPTSGKVAAYLGSYDPHTKVATISKDKAVFYLEHGAQPSERVAKLLLSEGVKLPSWVSPAKVQSRTVRHTDKLRRNRPIEEKPTAKAATKEAEPAVESATVEPDAQTEVADVPSESAETPQES
jgi:small subunit ribosomal protein S16